MKFIKVFTFALLLLGTNYVRAEDKMVQTDFTKAYTGLDDTAIINYKPKDCDFQVNQASQSHVSIFDKTATQTGTVQKE